MISDKIVSIGKAAKLLGVSIQTLRRWDEKGILKSFRPNPEGNRFYKLEVIELFLKEPPALCWKWASDQIAHEPAKNFYCPTKDIFTARLTSLEHNLEQIQDLGIHFSLLTSMVGEIGDNSYAHNLGNWPDVRGIFFAYDLSRRNIVLADRGRGILTTLSVVKPELMTHREALKTAFTEIISGRFPERRGNGLKSVARNVLTSNVELLYRTGNAQLDLRNGDKQFNITDYHDFHGCYAVLTF